MQHRTQPLQQEIQFHKYKEGLDIQIETERLTIRSVQPQDEKDCIQLMSDAKVMEKFTEGKPWEEARIQGRIKIWLQRWHDKDPFSVYTIRDKNTQEFMGIFAFGHSEPGETEASYLLHHRYWGKKYGKEAGEAMFRSLIPQLMLRGYKLEGEFLKKLVATARLDHPASQKILKNAGFQVEKKLIKYDAWRFSFGLFAKKLRNEYQNYFTHLDRKQHDQDALRSQNCDVDVTAEEMTNSAFGRGSFTAINSK